MGRPRESGFRPDIQGMRAVAVALVVLDHAGVPGLGGGYVGVDVFFVISGFLITGLLAAEARKTGGVSIRRFYVRRARRILPAAMLTLISCDVAAYALMNFVRAQQAITDSVWTAFFAANVRFAHTATNYFDRTQPPSPLLHYWSLAVEEQFYLVWPALLALLFFAARRVQRNGTAAAASIATAITVASLAWSVHETKADPFRAYYSPFVRAWELGLGAMLVFAAPLLTRLPARLRLVAGWGGLITIASAATVYSPSTAFPGSAALVPTVGAGLLIVAGLGALSPLSAGRVLSTAPFRWLGDRSYALYLWHWPILIIAAQHAGHKLSLGVNLMLIALAVAVSALSYLLVENPLRHSRWSGRTAIVVWPATVAGSVAAALLLLQLVSVQPAPAVAAPQLTFTARAQPIGANTTALPAVKAAVALVRRAAPIPSPLTPTVDKLSGDHYAVPPGCDAPDGPKITEKICRLGASSASKTIVAFGDSHVEEWLPAILTMAQQDGWTVVPFIKQGCTPPRWVKAYGQPACPGWFKWAIAHANALHPDVAVIGGSIEAGTGGSAQLYGDELAAIGKAVKALQTGAKTVMVIGDPPSVHAFPVDCLAGGGANMKRCSHARTPVQIKVYADVAAAAKAAHAGFVDTLGWFCWENVCPMVVGHTITYLDNNHATQTYVGQLATVFRQAFRRALFG